MTAVSTVATQSPPAESPSRSAPERAPRQDDMAFVPGGAFRMGSNIAYPDEAPEHIATVGSFWMDRSPVTNARFAAFVDATGYRTSAERMPEAAGHRGGLPARPGSLVFVKPARPRGPGRGRHWWRYLVGADWRHPAGPDSGLAGLEEHPVVHVTYDDAEAFAAWDGKQLPTEAEWECAARGGLDGATYAWGQSLMPEGRPMANYWQGHFPDENALLDGWEGTSPVASFPPNGYGLYDMIGNVWEWTTDWYQPRHYPRLERTGGSPAAPGGVTAHRSAVRRVLKGGSFVCELHSNHRYRPAARFPQPGNACTSDIGLRCIVRR